MAVNDNVYGTSEQWIDSFCEQYILNKDKIAYFGTNMSRLEQGVTQNKLTYDEGIDKSLSYCGLGTESALSHIGYFYQDSGVFKLVEWEDRFVTNFAFMQQNDSNINMSNYYKNFDLSNDELQKRCFWQPTRMTTNLSPKLQPYTKINPKNFVLLIRVEAYNATFSSSKKVTLSDYMTNWKDTYPCINVVYVDAYFNKQGHTTENPARSLSGTQYDLSTNQLTLQYCQLDSYNISGKNMSFYSYYLGQQPIMGSFIRSGKALYGSNRDLRFIAATENCKEHCKIYTTSNNNVFTYIEYFDGIVDEILKTVACFGLYFTDTESVATSGKLTNNNMFIGLLDENGIGHGEYLRGADTANAPQNNWNDMTQSGYDYEKEVDKTKYRNDTQFYAGYGTSSFTKFYALTETQVNQLSQELYRIANDVPSGTSITEYNMKMFLTNNPIDCIISLKKFPVDNIPLATTDATIYLGAKSTNITGKILVTPTWVYYFNFRNSADQSCRPIFGNNFLDYEPYTKCKIVIPFCGTVDVPVTYIYQYDDLQIALVMDFITGAVTAFILVNGITIDSITGSCAIDLPVSGIQSATLDSQIHSVAMAREKQQTTLGTGLIAGAVSIGIGLATGNLPAAIGGGAAIIGSFLAAEDKGKQINYDLTHMQTPVKQVSAASGQIAHTYDMRCKMVITRPEIAAEYSAAEYSKTIGFACLENGEVQNFHGLTLANIDLSGINCTAEEKNMIRAAFANGVYLPAEYSDIYWT